uniref:Uncharacterized protein n=1 Tax=Kalanchoe fedtschenkoi TaxID=63787 RepID=A0A7N0VJY3_KALFE
QRSIQQVGVVLRGVSQQTEQLELVDDLQRLGLAYHFENEIKTLLHEIYKKYYIIHEHRNQTDLHTAALAKFKLSLLEDIKGMISLYEASYLGTQGESIIEEAFDFTATHLPKLKILDPYLEVLAAHSLDFPLHWRPSISEARWWWTKLDFGEDLSFARDTLVASYLWGIQIAPQPQYEACRGVVTKLTALVSAIDDIYDVYGTLEELELFTMAFERWDTSTMEQLPACMKKCFSALNKSITELADDVLRGKGLNVLENLKKMWINQARAYMTEARWYHNGDRPTLDEYMANAWISVCVPLFAVHDYVVNLEQVTQTVLKCLENDADFLKSAGIIARLVDDLGTSSDEMARGDVPKAVECYMNDIGASKEAARNHVKDMVREEWKKLNKHAMENKTLPHSTVTKFPNYMKAAHFFYMHGGAPDLPLTGRGV